MSLRNYLSSKVFVAQVAAAVAIVALIAYGFFHWITFITHHGDEITVPNLSKLTELEVEEKLGSLDLDYQIVDTVDYKSDFPNAPSYNRFVELIPRAFLPLLLFAVYRCSLAKRTGIYFLDSTKLPVCFITRAHSHKVFLGAAAKGKTSTGWFFGLKLHLIINNLGELVHFYLSCGSKSDSDALILFQMTKNLFGMFYTDAGYQMNEEKRLLLELDRLRTFIVKPRSNMKKAAKPLLFKDVLWHKKRPTIESVIDIQKVHLDLNLNRQRSAINGFTTVFANLAAYSFYPDKPSASSPTIYELHSGDSRLKTAA